MCTFENWIRLSKPFRFQTDQKLAVGYLVTWFGEYFETVLVVNGRHLMWILPLRYSCLFQTLTERMKNLFSFSNWSPISFVIALDCWWNQMSFSRGHFSRLNAFQFTNQYLHLNFKAKMNESSSMGTKNILYNLFPRHDSSRFSSPDAVDISFSLQQLFSASLPVLWPVFINVSVIWLWKQNNGSKHARKFCWHA